MAEAPENRLPMGYDEDFVNEVESDFECSICHLALKEAVQTRCGHRFCNDCLEEHFKRQGVFNPPTCPVDRRKLRREKDIFPDTATQRKILSLVIKCPNEGCDWTGELRNKENHLGSCSFMLVVCTNESCQVKVRRIDLQQHLGTCQWRIITCKHCSESHTQCLMKIHVGQCSKVPVSCPNDCGGSFPREMIPSHTNVDCPQTLIPCPYVKMGCKTKVRRRQVESHLQSVVRLHLDLACAKLENTEQKLNNTQVKLNITEQKLNDVQVKLNSTEVKLNDTQIKLNGTEVKLNDTQVTVNSTEVKLNDTQVKLKSTEQKLNDTQVKLNSSEITIIKTEETTKKLMEKINLLQKRIDEKVLEDKIAKMENLCFVWKIGNFSEHLRQARYGGKYTLDSAPFYREMYKYTASIYPNGSGSGLNTHLSVFISVNKGEYDAILSWPVEKRVKFALIDQQENLFNSLPHNLEFMTSCMPGCFERSTGSMDKSNGGGYDKFISHEKLYSRRYLVDDTLFLKVFVGGPSFGLESFP